MPYLFTAGTVKANKEQVFVPEGSYLVSRTDTRGVIQYVNANFVEISGYTEAELLGQPHRLVRHPDMPSVVFEDMWFALKRGLPWRGLVKNRCKDGRYYWVKAQVAPVYEGNQISGFASTRTMAAPVEIQEAELLYRSLRDGTISPSTYRRKYGAKAAFAYRSRFTTLVPWTSRLSRSSPG